MADNSVAVLDQTICASLYFTAVLSTAFYGISCMQMFFYYVHYPDDSRRMKIFVTVLWALETIHEALAVSGVYKYTIAMLENPLSVLITIPEIITLVAVLSQGFFAHRIYKLSESIIPPLLWVVAAIFQIVIIIVYEAKASYTVDGSLHVVPLSVIVDNFFLSVTISGLSVAAAVDVLLAIAMTIILVRLRATTEFAHTAHMLQRFTMFTVNTGFWTAVFAVLSVVLMHAFPSNAYYAVFSIPLSSIYYNTILANLNARAYIRNGTTTPATSTELVVVHLPPSGNVKSKKRSGTFSRIHVIIQKITESVILIHTDESAMPEDRPNV